MISTTRGVTRLSDERAANRTLCSDAVRLRFLAPFAELLWEYLLLARVAARMCASGEPFDGSSPTVSAVPANKQTSTLSKRYGALRTYGLWMPTDGHACVLITEGAVFA